MTRAKTKRKKQEEAFIEVYKKTHNACEAVREAYPHLEKEGSVKSKAWRLMHTNSDVSNQIAYSISQAIPIDQANEVLREKVLSEKDIRALKMYYDKIDPSSNTIKHENKNLNVNINVEMDQLQDMIRQAQNVK